MTRAPRVVKSIHSSPITSFVSTESVDCAAKEIPDVSNKEALSRANGSERDVLIVFILGIFTHIALRKAKESAGRRRHNLLMHLLLVEDDLDLGRALQAALKVEGFSSEWLRRARDVPRPLPAEQFDAALLDLSLPDGSGMDLLRQWRGAGQTLPVLIITARGEVHDRLTGLDSGADDFLVKPFAMAELISRIRAVLRRSARQATDRWALGRLSIEPRKHLVELDGIEIDVSPREFQILLELAREPGAVVSKSVLAQRLEPLGDPIEFAALEVHISNLRRKIGSECIRTLRGVGYMLVIV
jgi:two-component system, OmpR family, response regulator QseB